VGLTGRPAFDLNLSGELLIREALRGRAREQAVVGVTFEELLAPPRSTREQILGAAEEVLRLYGSVKANVVVPCGTCGR
jgi:hypothetical protein